MASDYSRLEYVVIGTSAGGLDALYAILPSFKRTQHFKVFVVIHLPPSGPNLIPELLKDMCELKVKEAEPGEELIMDTIYVSPPDYHLCLEPNGILSLSAEGLVNFSRPSIDILFESAAYAFGKRVLGILLTGANNDGALGLKNIIEAGGIAIVQDPVDAQYDTMPRAALDILKTDLVLTSKEIASFIADRCAERKRYA